MLTRKLGPEGSGLRYPTSVGEENETPFIRVWKPLPIRHVLKTLRESSKGKPKEHNIYPQWVWAVTKSLCFSMVSSTVWFGEICSGR